MCGLFTLGVPLVLSITMPPTSGYEVVKTDAENALNRLSVEWDCVRRKRLNHKNEHFRKRMKERMDLILRVNQKFKKCKESLQALHLVYASVWRDGETELHFQTWTCYLSISVISDVFLMWGSLGVEPHHISRKSLIMQK